MSKRTYTNHTLGLRGILLLSSATIWLDPGKSEEIDPKEIVEPMPDLGAPSHGGAQVAPDTAALDDARREGAAMALAQIDDLKAKHADAMRVEADRADAAEEALAVAQAQIDDLKAKLDSASNPPSDIKTAIDMLDPANEGHWTKEGLPAVDAIKALIGGDATRADIEAAAPDFNREAAKVAA